MMPFTDGWRVRVPPKPDELLSSWFVRTAWANAEKLETFTSRHFGSHSSYWKRDTDRFMDTAILVPLAHKSGLGRKEIYSMMLTPFEGILYLEAPKTSVLPWVLPVRKDNRKNLGDYVVYCLLCLAEDEDPYFRRFWRLALAIACPKHGTRLLDACPACGAPAAFHMVDCAQNESVGAFTVASCHRCRRDLRNAVARAKPADQLVLNLVTSLHAIPCHGAPVTSPSDGRSSMLPVAYFQILRSLAKWLATRSATIKLRAAVLALSGLPGFVRSQTDHTHLCKQRPIEERYFQLQMIAWLLADWPCRFVAAGRRSGVRPSYLATYRASEAVPFWIQSVLATNFAAFRVSATTEERHNLVRFLAKNGLRPNQYRVDRWLGKSRPTGPRRAAQMELAFPTEPEWSRFAKSVPN